MRRLLLTQTHSSCGYLHTTWTRLSQSKLQHVSRRAAEAPIQSKELLAVGRVTFAESEVTSMLLCIHVCLIPMHTWAALVGFSYHEGRKERRKKRKERRKKRKVMDHELGKEMGWGGGDAGHELMEKHICVKFSKNKFENTILK